MWAEAGARPYRRTRARSPRNSRRLRGALPEARPSRRRRHRRCRRQHGRDERRGGGAGTAGGEGHHQRLQEEPAHVSCAQAVPPPPPPPGVVGSGQGPGQASSRPRAAARGRQLLARVPLLRGDRARSRRDRCRPPPGPVSASGTRSPASP